MKARVMILAAGRGTRMGALGTETPKPATDILGRSLIMRALDHIADAGLGPAVVNVHHLANRMEAHLAEPIREGRVLISDERTELLDTAGGIGRALPLLDDVFMVINGDALWLDGAENTLNRLWQAYDPAREDILMLAAHRARSTGYEGAGDLLICDPSRDGPDNGEILGDVPRMVQLNRGRQHVDLLYAGIMMVQRKLYEGERPSVWSNSQLFAECAARDRLAAIAHQGMWMHVGTPGAIRAAEAVLQGRTAGAL